MAGYDIISLGILVFDVFGTEINQFPAKGTSEFFDSMESHPGGCAYNTGVGASRLGSEVAVMGMVGSDFFGDFILRNLAKENVNAEGIAVSEKTNTAFSFVMIPKDGQRRIYTSFGANSHYSYSHIDLSRVAASRILHVAGVSLLKKLDGEPLERLLKFARENGVITSMDPVVKKDIGDIVIPCLKYLDIFIPNKEESYYITGLKKPIDQLRFYINAGVRIAGVKMGAEGCLISDGKKIYRFGIHKVPVVDTCGAGDAFAAGFLYGTVQGWDLVQAAEFAASVASFCVRSTGATEGIPDASTVLEFSSGKKLLQEVYSY